MIRPRADGIDLTVRKTIALPPSRWDQLNINAERKLRYWQASFAVCAQRKRQQGRLWAHLPNDGLFSGGALVD